MKRKDVVFIGIKINDGIADNPIIKSYVGDVPEKNEHHLTIRFMPKDINCFSEYVGKEIDLLGVKLGRYGEENIGILIKGEIPLFNGKVPHVTVAVANGGKAKNTALCAWDTDVHIPLKGIFGYFDRKCAFSTSLEE